MEKRLLTAAGFTNQVVEFQRLFIESAYLKDYKVKGEIFSG